MVSQSPLDTDKRVHYCCWFQRLAWNVSTRHFFRDEAWFYLNGYINSKNTRLAENSTGDPIPLAETWCVLCQTENYTATLIYCNLSCIRKYCSVDCAPIHEEECIVGISKTERRQATRQMKQWRYLQNSSRIRLCPTICDHRACHDLFLHFFLRVYLIGTMHHNSHPLEHPRNNIIHDV